MNNQFEKISILDKQSLDLGINSPFGYRPQERPIKKHIQYGFVNLDKHSGPTSHEIVSIVKKILNIEKAGHSGTLDPQVTGVLPIGLLSSTKVLFTLLSSQKVYICNMQTSSIFDFDEWVTILEQFVGRIYQVPPLKSNVVKKLRIRAVYDIELLEVKEKEVLFKVFCEAGTYIRTLCVDIGRSIGCNAIMKELRRIQTGPFNEDSLVTLHQIFDAYADYKENNVEDGLREVIQPVENAITHLPKIIVRENCVDSICHGTDLFKPGIIAYTQFDKGQIISILTPKNELIALGRTLVDSNRIDFASTQKTVHPEKVIMERGLYPSYKLN